MKDYFSGHSEAYAKHRPVYPRELYEYILENFEKREVAWDCGTGNGQAAKGLSNYFGKVWATDISQKQIDSAQQKENINYSIQPAEQTDFPDNSVDLVTVAQALHWFNFEKFYSEVKRVCKNGGWIAVWTYNLPIISPAIDKIILKHYLETLDGYWDKEREYVDDNYSTIPFPFEEIRNPVFNMEFEWDANDLGGYLNTWSALQKYIRQNKVNPLDQLMGNISELFEKEKMKMVFPLHLRMGRIQK